MARLTPLVKGFGPVVTLVNTPWAVVQVYHLDLHSVEPGTYIGSWILVPLDLLSDTIFGQSELYPLTVFEYFPPEPTVLVGGDNLVGLTSF